MGRVCSTRGKINTYKILVEIPEGENDTEDRVEDGKIILA